MKLSQILLIACLFVLALSKPCIRKPCRPTGCSGEICSDKDIASICIWKPEFECYQAAECKRQANGKCGWTQTQELEECIANAGSETA